MSKLKIILTDELGCEQIYREKKEAWAKFQREEGYKGNAAQSNTLASSHSVNTVPHQGNFAFGTMGTVIIVTLLLLITQYL